MRAAEERAKPNAERLPEYTDSRLPLLEKEVLDAKPVYPALERLELEFWLTKVREYLDRRRAGDRGLPRQGFAGDLGRAPLRLRPSPTRRCARRCGMAACRPSGPRADPLIRYVLATDPTARAVRGAI